MLTVQSPESVIFAPVSNPADPAQLGRSSGLQDGYHEGYLRGRASVIMQRERPPFAVRNAKVVYVASGKGFPMLRSTKRLRRRFGHWLPR